MMRDWRKRGDDEPLPRFPDVKREAVKLEVSVVISDWSSVLQDWFLNLSKAQRELVVFEAYRKEKLAEVGVKE